MEEEEGRRKEGGRKEEEKDGPLIRLASLINGIKLECLGTLGTYYGLDQGFMQGSCVEEEEGGGGGERRAPNKACQPY